MARMWHRGAAYERVWLDEVAWDSQGLVPAIAQESGSGRLLMMAWMNRDALAGNGASGRAVYWSRSRKQACGAKGEESGHVQLVRQSGSTAMAT